MATTPKLEPGVFAQSPSIPIAVQDSDDGKTYMFYLPTALLKDCSSHITGKLTDFREESGDPAFSVATTRKTFEDFCNWLYNGAIDDALDIKRIHLLWKHAVLWRVASLRQDLVQWVRENINHNIDMMYLLQNLVRSKVNVREELPKYLLEKIAYEAARHGWGGASGTLAENWGSFMSMRGAPAEYKKEYLLKFVSKLEAAEDRYDDDALEDPALIT
ncbi:hypothetical protein H2200_000316 [Cladophialophora chaetospira]|uniref:BTB domain-containing protein n=1 Tax=Cladophialophora chaetospira TaxID=386627 RepID=A0AA38XNB0_9EURO|nr:hypothetical protein H2200_000316 [Cladophialophora chaetospira]